MTTFGNRETAVMLASHFPHNSSFNERTGRNIRTPAGFSKLGEGCYRSAWLEKSTNLVYKVGNYDANVAEAFNARRLMRKSQRSLPFEIVIPRTRTFRVSGIPHRGTMYKRCVSVQEFAGSVRNTDCEAMYFLGACDCKRKLCFSKILSIVEEWSDLKDIHGENVLVERSNPSRFWLIDLAS